MLPCGDDVDEDDVAADVDDGDVDDVAHVEEEEEEEGRKKGMVDTLTCEG